MNTKTPQPTSSDLFAPLEPKDRPNIPAGDARFLVETDGGVTTIRILASRTLEDFVARNYLHGDRPEPQVVIRLDFPQGTMSIYPQLIYHNEQLYQPRYKRLREIQIPLPKQKSPPETHEDVVGILKKISSGFIKDPAYGLGFIREMRPLRKAIEEIKAVNRLVISPHHTTKIDANTFYLNEDEYDQLRSDMARVTRTYQKESLTDRTLMAYNASIHVALPDKFPRKDRPYKPGTVFKILGGSNNSGVVLRGKDRRGLLNAVATNAAAIAKRDPQEFIQLQKDIELASLEQLIDKVTANIKRNSLERVWQELLELNPFILSMLFGQPVVLLQAGASVGGQTLEGGGTKIADFLMANSLTKNAALVELKRPKTPLLSSKLYRGILPAHYELMGAVSQVLDQRDRLITSIATTLRNNELTFDVPSVECFVLAGRTPKEKADMRSFELIRGQFKDVHIVTFDELLERLHTLRQLLAGERYEAIMEDEDDLEFEEGDIFDEGDDGADVEDFDLEVDE